MSEALTELEALREATRPRLNKTTVAMLREEAEAWHAVGTKHDVKIAESLNLLLDMHDRLEAIRNGH
ncbi:hypothetical protein UFOVP1324_15 [uncultured Caudovirales phage]|uniref:Uncharacterized protein n=1 Tax=uncultured Caudovirales phage TaxID=2100421 RepID=A0A6J5RYX2_9CAUD|nr:hypothetical protein UFOVP1324_15 [uncultured Caudovirales phage]